MAGIALTATMTSWCIQFIGIELFEFVAFDNNIHSFRGVLVNVEIYRIAWSICPICSLKSDEKQNYLVHFYKHMISLDNSFFSFNCSIMHSLHAYHDTTYLLDWSSIKFIGQCHWRLMLNLVWIRFSKIGRAISEIQLIVWKTRKGFNICPVCIFILDCSKYFVEMKGEGITNKCSKVTILSIGRYSIS